MRHTPELNAGSMADIAFTLLIFFLVSTTLATDLGKRVVLPPWQECTTCIVDILDEQVLRIDLLPNGEILIEEESATQTGISEQVNQFLTNHLINNGTELDYYVILFAIDPNTDYASYLEAYSRARQSIQDLRETVAEKLYNQTYASLTDEAAKEIRMRIPFSLVENSMDF